MVPWMLKQGSWDFPFLFHFFWTAYQSVWWLTNRLCCLFNRLSLLKNRRQVLVDHKLLFWKRVSGWRNPKNAALPFSCGRRIRILPKTMTPSPHPSTSCLWPLNPVTSHNNNNGGLHACVRAAEDIENVHNYVSFKEIQTSQSSFSPYNGMILGTARPLPKHSRDWSGFIDLWLCLAPSLHFITKSLMLDINIHHNCMCFSP